jgi:hypothetical protein
MHSWSSQHNTLTKPRFTQCFVCFFSITKRDISSITMSIPYDCSVLFVWFAYIQILHMLHHVTTMILRPLDFPLPTPRSQCDPASFKALSACHGANLAANHLETGRVLWGHESWAPWVSFWCTLRLPKVAIEIPPFIDDFFPARNLHVSIFIEDFHHISMCTHILSAWTNVCCCRTTVQCPTTGFATLRNHPKALLA